MMDGAKANAAAILDQLRSPRAAFAHDLLMIPAAWFGALWLRFDLSGIPEPLLEQALYVIPIMLIAHGAPFWYFGLYRGVWRFASMPDLLRIIKAVFIGVVTSMALVFLVNRMESVPRSAFVLHGILLVVLLGAPRFVYRWIKDYTLSYRRGARVLIVGAGQAGETLVRDLLAGRRAEYQPVAFVDDDPHKRGKDVRGIRVVGRCDTIPEVVRRYQIDMVFIAMPSAPSEAMRRIVARCEESRKPIRTLPRLQDLLSGRVTLRDLREVSIDDLLGREAVSLDWETVTERLRGKTVLVSGGGGSIGSELCRQLAALRPAALIVLEHCELNLYEIESELRRSVPAMTLHARLGDVCDHSLVHQLMEEYRPDAVFHAAAFKHVPMLQNQPREAVRNNVLGTANIADAAANSGCETFVLISTDKAVNPSSIMGASKRLAEIYCQTFGRRAKTRFLTVRFGNVLGSAGSVVPLFTKQIAAGGPVTVTHPEVSRYFMTIAEACQLILQVGSVGNPGEIYVLDMGEPVTIRYLAEQMIRLSGKVPHEDIAIDFVGLRPGEKLHEELFHGGEVLLATRYPKLLLARTRPVDRAWVLQGVGALRRACEQWDEDEILRLIRALVPEYQGGEEQPKAVPALRAVH